MAVSCIVSEI